MKLITEHTTEVEYIVEGKNKQQYIKGVFLQSDIKNQNGRVYPYSVLKKQVRKFNENFVKKDLPTLSSLAYICLVSCSVHILNKKYKPSFKSTSDVHMVIP